MSLLVTKSAASSVSAIISVVALAVVSVTRAPREE